MPRRPSRPKPGGYLPQGLHLYPDMTARDLLDYIGILKSIGGRATRRSQVDSLLWR